MNSDLGEFGENFVSEWLERQGLSILDRNYHSRYGEIDIIAADEQYIVFVEVKTRSEHYLVSPLEAITPQKQKRIIRTAQLYLLKNPVLLQPRFDVAAVIVSENPTAVKRIDYLENAFGERGD